jgi:hypothetical protein
MFGNRRQTLLMPAFSEFLLHDARVVGWVELDTVRELPEFAWCILYEVRSEGSPAQVEVLAVIHIRQNLQPDDIAHRELDCSQRCGCVAALDPGGYLEIGNAVAGW